MEKAKAVAAKVALNTQKETPSFPKVSQEVDSKGTVILWNLVIQPLNRVWRHGFGDSGAPNRETFFVSLTSSFQSRMSQRCHVTSDNKDRD